MNVDQVPRVGDGPVGVVIPCFDEAQRLDVETLTELGAAVDQLLFVDDGSTDATPSLLADAASRIGSHAGVVTLPENRGKAEAVRIGLQRLVDDGCALVAYLDADLATPPAELLRLIAVAQRQPARTAVLGSRVALLGHTVRRRPMRHYLGRCYATAASLVLGVPVYDTQCGAKVFRVGVPLQMALADPFADRWAFDVELLGRLLAHPDQAADPFLEVPLERWLDIDGSAVGPIAGLRAGFALLGLRRRVRRHRARYVV